MLASTKNDNEKIVSAFTIPALNPTFKALKGSFNKFNVS